MIAKMNTHPGNFYIHDRQRYTQIIPLWVLYNTTATNVKFYNTIAFGIAVLPSHPGHFSHDFFCQPLPREIPRVQFLPTSGDIEKCSTLSSVQWKAANAKCYRLQAHPNYPVMGFFILKRDRDQIHSGSTNIRASHLQLLTHTPSPVMDVVVVRWPDKNLL